MGNGVWGDAALKTPFHTSPVLQESHFKQQSLKVSHKAPPPILKNGRFELQVHQKYSQNFSSHALKSDSSSSQDPLFRGNFQFASPTLRKSRLDSEHPYLNTCWVTPHTHTHKQQQHLLCRNDTYPLRHDLKDSEYSNLKEKPGNIHYNWIEHMILSIDNIHFA